MFIVFISSYYIVFAAKIAENDKHGTPTSYIKTYANSFSQIHLKFNMEITQINGNKRFMLVFNLCKALNIVYKQYINQKRASKSHVDLFTLSVLHYGVIPAAKRKHKNEPLTSSELSATLKKFSLSAQFSLFNLFYCVDMAAICFIQANFQ